MITLYTDCTPNGFKISIALEELGLDYQVVDIDFSKREQFSSQFLKLNPNAKIPVIVDHDNDNYCVFESGAILQYLAEKTGQLIPKNEKKRLDMMQWLFWQTSGLGPYVGQLLTFAVALEEQIPTAIERYLRESRRLLNVLNGQLENKDYIIGDEHTIADIAAFPWVRILDLYPLPVELSDYPHVETWYKKLSEKPAYSKGVTIPPTAERQERLKIFRSALV